MYEISTDPVTIECGNKRERLTAKKEEEMGDQRTATDRERNPDSSLRRSVFPFQTKAWTEQVIRALGHYSIYLLILSGLKITT